MKPNRFRFRAWDKHLKKMYPPTDIQSIDNDFDEEILGCINLRSFHGSHAPSRYARPLDSVILMQSTGLSDKKGNEVFEGDIVCATDMTSDHDDCVGAIEWDGYGYCITGGGGFYSLEDMYIVGNTHENPELIKENDY